MQPIVCPVCGASNSELDSQCTSCGTRLPNDTLANGKRGRHPPPAVRDNEDDDELLLGQQISHFRILGRLGKGGMGKVLRALDLELGREVALKFLHSQGERRRRDRARFQREAQALAALDHPNIGTIYEIGEWNGRRFIAMALYDGETLADLLARQPDRKLPVPEATAIISQLAEALQAAHTARLVHRDLKPANVMILPDGRVKLIDFGLARWPESSRLTAQGQVAGTPAYMAPEQLAGEDASSASDLWALGVVLYEMLAGRHPFRGKGLGMVQSIMDEEPFPLREACPEVPEELEKTIDRCLVKEPGERWPSARGILNELQVKGPSSSGSLILPPPPILTPARRRWKIAAVASFLLLGACIAVYFLLRPPSPVYVAVLQPEITGSLQPDAQDRVKVNIRAALLRTVALLDGLVAQDPNQIDAVKGDDPRLIARVLGADEVITPLAYCAGDDCRVTLKYLEGQSTTTGFHPSKPRLFATMVSDLLRKKYRNRKLRVPQLDLKAGEEEYRTYLNLLQRSADPTVQELKVLKELLDQLQALRQRAHGFLEVYLLEANLCRRFYDSTQDVHSLDRGIAVAKQAQELAPRDPRLLKDLFDLYSDAGYYQKAGMVLDELAKVDPSGSLFRRSQLEERQGHAQEALKLRTEATDLHPSRNAFLFLANYEYQQGLLKEARGHYQDALKLDPDSLSALKGLIQVELLVDPKQAIQRLREIVKRDPGPDSRTNLGTALMWLRRFGEAEGYLRQALTLSPEDPSAALNLADCLLLLKRPLDAQESYARVEVLTRSTNPSDWQHLSVRAQALAHLGRAEEAENTLQTALSVAPDSQQLACEAALVYVALGRQTDAVSYARRAAAGPAADYCLGFPQFDPLRQNPDFQKLSKAHSPAK